MNIAQSLVDQINKTLAENKEKSKNTTSAWCKGDKVRVLKSIHINTHTIQDYLGQICIVESVILNNIFQGTPCYTYWLRLGNNIEPFEEWELDYRFKSLKTNS